MRAADRKKQSPGQAVLINEIYSILNRHYGDLEWWPGETPFEVIVGAILTQNTSWDNVSRAVANLKSAGMLCPFRLYSAQPGRIAELIRPSGYYNVKTRRLRHFLHFLHGEFGGDIDAMFRLDTLELRRRLLSVNGIGEETADSILLKLKPHLHAKGTDYSKEGILERKTVLSYGGDTVIVGDPKDHSSSGIIETIRGWRQNNNTGGDTNP